MEDTAIKAVSGGCMRRTCGGCGERSERTDVYSVQTTANAEQLVDYETGEPFTAHTVNPVPFILVNADPSYGLREGGCLADIAPTLIELMGMEQPKEMTGEKAC